jgi:hypothetical protein
VIARRCLQPCLQQLRRFGEDGLYIPGCVGGVGERKGVIPALESSVGIVVLVESTVLGQSA